MAGGKFTVSVVFDAKDRMSVTVDKMESKVKSFTNSFAGGLKKIDDFNSKISAGFKMAGAAIAATGAGLAYAGYNVAKTGVDFEQAITNVGAVSLMTRSQIQDLEAEARKLGKSTKFSAIEVAGGMELMGKAGFTNKQILEDIGPVLSAAAAEGAEFAEVAGVMSNTLNGMGLDKTAKNTQMVADVLTLASARTNSSITSLGESMKNLAPIARQFKIPFDDAVSSVALLQDVGIDASEAGTSMATMLTKLATPTDGIKAKMRQLGVTFQNAEGNMLSLPEVFANFGTAAAKSGGNMKQAAFFAELVGLRGQRAALNMQEMFKTGRFKELSDALKDSAGKAKEMADIRMNTLGGDLSLLSNTVDDLKISIFDMNSGPLRGVVKDMTAWVTANQELIKTRVGEFAKGLSDWAVANKDNFIQVGRAIGDGLTWVAQNMPTIVKWVERLGKSALYFYAFSSAVKVAQTGIEAYQVAVTLAKGAQWLFVGSLGATGTALDGAMGARAALNASTLGTKINGVTGLLGKAGLLGAALGVGVAFGTWLNTTFQLDEKISGLVARLTGLDNKLNQHGGRARKPGLQPGGDQYLADGSIRAADGSWKYKSPLRVAKEKHKTPDYAWTSPGLPGKPSDNYLDGPMSAPMVVSPQESIARSVTESTETTKAEITIKDESGKATVTQPPKAPRFSIILQQSGAF